MGALLPTLQANRLREGLTDYLATTFALTDADTKGALVDFIEHPRDGMFKGPYVRLRLPFAPATGNWGMHLDWLPPGFVPYGHQAKAFERLSTKFQARPQPTLVTTGTGSGKTESFLIPILDHVLRAKKAGVAGMKALIIYPMNALANDQEQRLARLIVSNPELAGVTAGLYTGEGASSGRTLVSADGLITDRRLMHDSPPDILLTNYKMLDHMLLRPDRAPMWRQSAHSLQYVVLDEFHTYDGAQGTDVAMLLRRLGLTLKSYWSDDAEVSAEDRARPLGLITPVATSATLGSEKAPTAMLDFAHTVFGEAFTADAVVGETRLTPEQWLAQRNPDLDRSYRAISHPALDEDSMRELAKQVDRSLNNAGATAVILATLLERADSEGGLAERAADLRKLNAGELLDLLKTHRAFHNVLRASEKAISLPELAERVLETTASSAGQARDAARRQRYLEYVFAALSDLRARIGGSALNVDVHLWVRELSRIDRNLATNAEFHWADDGSVEDAGKNFFPAVFCRHCGRSGWGVRLGPTGNTLDVTDESIRGYHAGGGPRFRALISAPVEAQLGKDIDGLRWLRISEREIVDETPDPESAEVLEGRILPVLVLTGLDADDNSQKDLCPACRTPDGIRFLGSAVATQLSVALSNMFGDAELDDAEKKALMFTDSVQDAAHRAGFVQARSHTLSLRSTLRSALGSVAAESQLVSLPDLCEAVIERAGEDPARRYSLLAPDIVERDEFRAYWDPATNPAARAKARRIVSRRVQFDIDLEFGLQSRLGRTLELTGSVVAEVDLGSQHRIVDMGTAAVRGSEHQLTFDEPDPTAVIRWVRGTVERMRTQGAIAHPWLDKYITKDANRRWVWGGRRKDEGMPAFPKGRPAPAFPAVGGRTIPEGFDAITAPAAWYARWATKCLGVSAFEGGFLARSLFAVLAEQRILSTSTTEKKLTVYQLRDVAVLVGATELADLEAGRNLLTCDVCQTPVPGTDTVTTQLDDAPCMSDRCPGTLHRTERTTNFYRKLYDESEMKRVVAREHTSLLPTEVRLDYETKFKRSDLDPTAPNVLVATPTLEMGIDIGDLSTVMLGSMPRTVSSYLQRVGRAGRSTGNSLVLAFVRGRGEHLPKLYDPTSIIQGEVRPPATFLKAEEILQRQYVAHIVDRLAREPGAQDPIQARAVLGTFDQGSWMATLLALADEQSELLLDEFLAQFDGLLDERARDALRSWAARSGDDQPSELVAHLREAVHRWNRDVTELTTRRKAVDAAVPEFEKRANSPAATDDDRRELRTARGTLRILGKHISDLTTEHWVGVLERYGVLPNYTLLDDSVTLDVGITWFDPESNQYAGKPESYQRGARVALTELAPGATFYAQGLAVQIDAVDLGPGESNIHIWRICPDCGWVRITQAAVDTPPPVQCPRCHTSAVADVSQQLRVVEMARVSAEVRRDEAAITDARDDRRREQFKVVAAADINPDEVVDRWFVTDRDFGAEYLQHIDIRWLNVGRRNSQGAKRFIAGEETASGLFRVCSGCGQLDRVAGANQAHEHRAWCRYRNSTDEKHVREIALARTLRTQAVLLHVPNWLQFDIFTYPSLSAAVLLGLRQVIGGSPEHLDVLTIADALHAPNQRALLIHDTVPGGTGYLAEFADPAKVWAVLAAARKVLHACDCATEQRQACHKCLLSFAPPHELDKVSRQTAARVLDELLGAGKDVEPHWNTWEAALTREKPKRRVGSAESPLERRFYAEFIKRLRTVGATITEHPGTYAASATIVMPGTKIRTWTLTPQVQMGSSRPDFRLLTRDPEVPEIAIFADGRSFHASTEDRNRVADDAGKREILRSGNTMVWSFGHEDLEHFITNTALTPSWHSAKRAETIMKNGTLRPALLKLLTADPITQLLEFMLDPDREAWAAVGQWLPMMFIGKDRAKGELTAVVPWALDLLDGKPPTIPDGEYMCWSYTDGPLVITAAMRSASGPIHAVLALDDRDDELGISNGQAWKDWVRLSNWFGLCDNHMITAYSLLATQRGGPEPTPAVREVQLDSAWQAAYSQSFSTAEKELVRALAAAEVPVPEVGGESEEGEVLDFAWPQARVAVLFDTESEAARLMADRGWTICPPDAERIVEILNTNGAR
ncbi:DEAD/DEAH box helicase [Nocardia nova]|uniref:DEAD/DEAH box helicase n=1 Tax=Nocardia nova TaxID=37330 RepID=A0A2S6AAX6_9NOCA|nr:DEAD/DEAH box helicase [Nocardia nova]PPJ30640.1 DEAD/DEAH box helicase [Nocardia nova]